MDWIGWDWIWNWNLDLELELIDWLVVLNRPPKIWKLLMVSSHPKYYKYCWLFTYNRRRFRSYTSDNMDSWKAEVRRVNQKKEDVDARKDRKVAIHCVFPMICGSGGSKSRLAKAAGAEPAGQMRKEKLHAVVARSTFPSEKWQSTRGADHFWKLRCRKSARRCGAKHISKSKCTKHTMVGPLLEVAMSKKCTPLWREAHFQVKMLKTRGVRTTFGGSDVEKVSKKCTPLWREAHFEVKSVKKLRVLSLFWREDVEKVDTD